MRSKSQDKFKDKVRELTVRSRNLDAEVIVKLNQVIRGTAQLLRHALVHQPVAVSRTGLLDSAALALHEIQAFQLPPQPPDAPASSSPDLGC